MAEKNDSDRPLPFEPLPRGRFSSVTVEGQLYLWGGTFKSSEEREKELTSTLCAYEPLSEQWNFSQMNGTLPPGIKEGGSACNDRYIYFFGGSTQDYKDPSSGSLHSFNIDSLSWEQLSAYSADGPQRKTGCGMVAHEDCVIVFGGYCDDQSSSVLPGASYTNEMHAFDLREGKWSSPTVTGTQPPPCCYFSLTKIDDHRAVLFGGSQPGQRFTVKSNDVYILDLQRMHWSKLECSQNEPRPVERYEHGAAILNYGQDHPQLLVTGGENKGFEYFDDVWILDLQSGKWKEISLPEKYRRKRHGHCAAAINLTPELTEVVVFGGQDENLKHLSATTVLRFERSGVDWILKDCCDYSTGLGSTQRLEAKRELRKQ